MLSPCVLYSLILTRYRLESWGSMPYCDQPETLTQGYYSTLTMWCTSTQREGTPVKCTLPKLMSTSMVHLAINNGRPGWPVFTVPWCCRDAIRPGSAFSSLYITHKAFPKRDPHCCRPLFSECGYFNSNLVPGFVLPSMLQLRPSASGGLAEREYMANDDDTTKRVSTQEATTPTPIDKVCIENREGAIAAV